MDIPGLRLEHKIGEGGMATVWKANQVSLNRTVAVKALNPQFATDPDEVADFVNEARAAANLKHPNIIQVHDVGEHNGTYYIIMEYVNGATIGALLTRDGPFSQKQALQIADDLAAALEYAWDTARLIHRDIKPDNIMIDADGAVKLADLGLARRDLTRMTDDADATAAIEGTPNYMSPEQARGATLLDCRTDMYSLGATLYHMVTGALPFDRLPPMRVLEAQIEGELPNPRDVNPAVTQGLAALIRRLMMKAPPDRFEDWGAVRHELRKVASGRILLGYHEPDACSTIAAPVAPPVGARTARRTAPVLNVRPPRVPALAHLLVWIVLLAGWTAFGRFLLAHGLACAPAPPAVETALSPSAPLSIPAGMTEAEARRLGPLEADIGQYLLDGNPAGAVALIDEELAYAHTPPFVTEMETLRAMAMAVPQINSRIADNIRTLIGKKATLNIRDRKLTVELRAISGGNVNALIEPAGGQTDPRPVTFTIAELDPREKSRWLGKAEDPVTASLKYLLYREANDMRFAKVFAERSGPLAETFLAQLSEAPDDHGSENP
jgi:serine/threonine-protein kinase